MLAKVKLSQLAPYLAKGHSEICFRITEPSLETFVPKVSEPKIGTLLDFNQETEQVEIQLREDFRLTDEEAD